ncbi:MULTISPECIES: DUF3304 domain-containing protein [unclassified Pseudomonas]|uniref:DUF3304 domain-containing protein n=1 Tax=unclassified Pseudomonas TaxID=196821 RepID=UPI0021159CBE|nr:MULTISPECIES: DUF3304 domain-containing protein [unclassified Pseudomonas]
MVGGCSTRSEMLGAPVTGYNHTSAVINWFSVNGAGGPNLGPYVGGGAEVCCGVLPRVWNPGLRAIVEWEKDPDPDGYIKRDRYGRLDSEDYKRHAANYSRHKVIVEIPQYTEEVCALQVHFLPCDQVRVSTTCYTPSNPKYPDRAYFQMKESATCPVL